ncbi:hypothetical protein GE09DRAFT_1213472 [Coniochaeta sp. 2T2.1]|nr:hypothetical protein GE09DRAFT_1213472 [Coniochaeta sp. 2T2.1]
MDDRGFLASIKIGRAVRLLLKNGCSVGEKNGEGRCALQHFAEHDKEARAIEHVLAHHPEECAAAGCLDEALRISLIAGCFDNAYWLTDAGTSPSEEMVLEAMGVLAEEAKATREPTYMDVHYVLDDCKAFAEYAGIFGKDLQACIANYEKACP